MDNAELFSVAIRFERTNRITLPNGEAIFAPLPRRNPHLVKRELTRAQLVDFLCDEVARGPMTIIELDVQQMANQVALRNGDTAAFSWDSKELERHGHVRLTLADTPSDTPPPSSRR